MKKNLVILFVLLALVVSLVPSQVAQATGIPQTVTVCWDKLFGTDCVVIKTTTYASPKIEIVLQTAAQPVFGVCVGGTWKLTYENVSYDIPKQRFSVTSDNPNLPFSKVMDYGRLGTVTEKGNIGGEGVKFGVSDFMCQAPVSVFIGK